MIAAIIYALFGPLPESVGDAMDSVLMFFDQFMHGELTDEAYANLFLILGVFNAAALIIYWASYRISCKLYLKGVEQYDH